MLAEEGKDLAPGIHALLHPVDRPVPVEEAVAGAVVAVEFVRLAVLLQLGLVLVDLLRRGRLVLVAEAEPSAKHHPSKYISSSVNGAG